MAFPLGVLLTWLGIAGLWVSFHRTGATTPWGVYQEILGKGTDAAPAPSDGTKPAQSDPATDPATTPDVRDQVSGAVTDATGNPALGIATDALSHFIPGILGEGSGNPIGSGGVSRYGGQ